jgi:hypothetical protein
VSTNTAPITGTASTTIEPSLLETVLNQTPASSSSLSASQSLVGDCLSDRHPVLLGRYLIRYSNGRGEPIERWLASLFGLPVRTHDRVLLLQPGNWPEPVVIGVIDGFANRPETPTTSAANLELRSDEVVRIHGCRGEPLVEIRQEESGPLIRLLSQDVNLELPGKLKLAARSIELKAVQGGVKIAASDDVIVKGEMIKLN